MEQLKKGSMYIAEVAFSNNNPISRYICFGSSKNSVQFPTTEESWKQYPVDSLPYFVIIEEIESYLGKSKYHGKTLSTLRRDEDLQKRHEELKELMGNTLAEYKQLEKIFE